MKLQHRNENEIKCTLLNHGGDDWDGCKIVEKIDTILLFQWNSHNFSTSFPKYQSINLLG